MIGRSARLSMRSSALYRNAPPRFGALLRLKSHHLPKARGVVGLACRDDDLRLADVADLLQRVGSEDDHVRALARLDRSERLVGVEDASAVARRGGDRF